MKNEFSQWNHHYLLCQTNWAAYRTLKFLKWSITGQLKFARIFHGTPLLLMLLHNKLRTENWVPARGKLRNQDASVTFTLKGTSAVYILQEFICTCHLEAVSSRNVLGQLQNSSSQLHLLIRPDTSNQGWYQLDLTQECHQDDWDQFFL